MTDLQWEPNLVVFGGTFDPPHKGHSDCVEQVLKRFPKAQVFVTPCYQAPRTKDSVKVPVAGFEDRQAMCKLNFAALENVEIVDVERYLPCPNYTVQTLKHLRQGHKTEKLGFLIGGDQLRLFHRWFQPTEILHIASLIIVSRGRKAALLKGVETLSEKLSLPLQKEKDRLSLGSSKPIFLLSEPTTNSGSSIIRGKMSEDLPIPEDWLKMEVRDYISQHHLYRGSH